MAMTAKEISKAAYRLFKNKDTSYLTVHLHESELELFQSLQARPVPRMASDTQHP